MSTVNSLPSERVAVVGSVDPDAYAANDYDTGWVSMANFRRFMAIVQAGTLGASATLDAKLRVALDGSGTSPFDVPGSAITQLTQAGTDSDKQAIINFDPAQFADSAYTHVSLRVTVAVATSDAGAILLGFDALSNPASDNDASTVDSIAIAR
jgi:hypothetical protein